MHQVTHSTECRYNIGYFTFDWCSLSGCKSNFEGKQGGNEPSIWNLCKLDIQIFGAPWKAEDLKKFGKTRLVSRESCGNKLQDRVLTPNFLSFSGIKYFRQYYSAQKTADESQDCEEMGIDHALAFPRKCRTNLYVPSDQLSLYKTFFQPKGLIFRYH